MTIPAHRPAWVEPTLQCFCNGRDARPQIAPLRIYSTFAALLKQVPATAEVGTWKCHRCRKVHTITAAHLLSTCAGTVMR